MNTRSEHPNLVNYYSSFSHGSLRVQLCMHICSTGVVIIVRLSTLLELALTVILYVRILSLEVTCLCILICM